MTTDCCGRAVERVVALVGLALRLDRIRLFLVGKNQKAVVPLICGLALMIFPYFVSNSILLVVVGVVLMAIPYFVRL
jgi:hypothetical protein